jgi:Bacterial regulatory proteins, gntR family
LAVDDGPQDSEERLSNVYQQAYDRLVAMLLSGKYEPNTRLTEVELTKLLNECGHAASHLQGVEGAAPAQGRA